MEMRNTPTPWSYSGQAGDNYIMAKRGHERIRVAQVIVNDDLDPHETEANKELIVRAVNAHEALVRAAKSLEPLMDYPPVGYEDEFEALMSALALALKNP